MHHIFHPLQICTCIFHTCILHRCKLICFVLNVFRTCLFSTLVKAQGAVAQGNTEYVERFIYLGSVISSDGDVEADINLTTCGDPAHLASRLNWTSTPPSLSLQPYTPARLGRVQLEYVSSWTSFTSATYGRFWALHGRAT